MCVCVCPFFYLLLARGTLRSTYVTLAVGRVPHVLFCVHSTNLKLLLLIVVVFEVPPFSRSPAQQLNLKNKTQAWRHIPSIDVVEFFRKKGQYLCCQNSPHRYYCTSLLDFEVAPELRWKTADIFLRALCLEDAQSPRPRLDSHLRIAKCVEGESPISPGRRRRRCDREASLEALYRFL